MVLTTGSDLLRCDSCRGALAVQAYLSKVGGKSDEMRDELLDGSIMVECVLCDGGVMTLDDSSSLSRSEPDIWGFD